MDIVIFVFAWYLDEICYVTGRVAILIFTLGRVRILDEGQTDPRTSLRTRYEMFKRRERSERMVTHRFVSALGALVWFGPAALIVWLVTPWESVFK